MQDAQALSDEQEIVELITDLFVATGRRSWPAVLECFAPQGTFDMSSLGGPPAALTPAKDVGAGWERKRRGGARWRVTRLRFDGKYVEGTSSSRGTPVTPPAWRCRPPAAPARGP